MARPRAISAFDAHVEKIRRAKQHADAVITDLEKSSVLLRKSHLAIHQMFLAQVDATRKKLAGMELDKATTITTGIVLSLQRLHGLREKPDQEKFERVLDAGLSEELRETLEHELKIL